MKTDFFKPASQLGFTQITSIRQSVDSLELTEEQTFSIKRMKEITNKDFIIGFESAPNINSIYIEDSAILRFVFNTNVPNCIPFNPDSYKNVSTFVDSIFDFFKNDFKDFTNLIYLDWNYSSDTPFNGADVAKELKKRNFSLRIIVSTAGSFFEMIGYLKISDIDVILVSNKNLKGFNRQSILDYESRNYGVKSLMIIKRKFDEVSRNSLTIASGDVVIKKGKLLVSNTESKQKSDYLCLSKKSKAIERLFYSFTKLKDAFLRFKILKLQNISLDSKGVLSAG